MKVKYLLLSLMGAMALSASAQTTAPENQLPARKTAFDRSGGTGLSPCRVVLVHNLLLATKPKTS